MKNKIGLYFQLEIADGAETLLLVRQALKRIERLEDSGIDIKYVEVRARELAGLSRDKEIWVKIDSDKMTYIDAVSSFEWKSAFTKTFDAVQDRMLYEEADYTRDAGLVELSLP